MATLMTRRIRRDSNEYKIEISLDEESVAEKTLGITVTGAVRKVGDDAWDEVTYEVEVDVDAEQVVVKYEDEPVATIPLDLKLSDSVEFDGEDADIESDHDVIDRLVDTFRGLDLANPEAVLEAIPAPDPFLGCLLKGAVTTAVGQIIRCWNALQSRQSFGVVVRQMRSCLWEHKWNMLTTFMCRSGRCMVFFGLR